MRILEGMPCDLQIVPIVQVFISASHVRARLNLLEVSTGFVEHATLDVINGLAHADESLIELIRHLVP